MTTTRSHHDNVEKQFGSQASAYLSSAVHASGRDLVRLGERLAAFPQAHVLDLGCGAGHASFTAAQRVAHVTAYDLSSQMLDVVAGAAKAKGLNNINTRQGYAESLPFDDASFEVVISRLFRAPLARCRPGIARGQTCSEAGRHLHHYGCNVSWTPGAQYLAADGRSAARYLARAKLRQRRVVVAYH